jgi:hypothetical protein
MTVQLDESAISSLAVDFSRDGYAVLPDFFAATLMDHLECLIVAHFGSDPAFFHNSEFLTKAETEVIPWFPQRESVSDFDPVESDPRLERLTTAVLGHGWQRQYCMVMFSKPGSAGQAWHQDCPPDDATKFNLNRLVYTADIVDSIGGQLLLVPGSHRLGELPAGEPRGDMSRQIMLKPRKGDLVLLHGHTWHRVLPIHGGYRSSTNFRSAPAGTPEAITDVCVYRNMRYRFSSNEVIVAR